MSDKISGRKENHSKPVIGISSNVMVEKGGLFPGYKINYINKDYVDSVIASGGTPLILAFSTDIELIRIQVDMLDGMILSGGHDVFPPNYGEEPRPKLEEVFPDRDSYDFMLLEEAKKRRIPILGICRGAQVINAYEGGTLYQDLSYMNNEELYKHSQGHDPRIKTHAVNVERDSVLYKAFGEEQARVNSFHHQAIKEVAPDYKVTVKAGDGVIEAIESKSYPFLVGVQWHPEMLIKDHEDMRRLFELFIKECSE
jgi:anthranilate synthase component II